MDKISTLKTHLSAALRLPPVPANFSVSVAAKHTAEKSARASHAGKRSVDGDGMMNAMSKQLNTVAMFAL